MYMMNWNMKYSLLSILASIITLVFATDTPSILTTSTPSIAGNNVPPTVTETRFPTLYNQGMEYDTDVKHRIVGYGVLFSFVGIMFCIFLVYYTTRWFNEHDLDDPHFAETHQSKVEMERKNMKRQFNSFALDKSSKLDY